MKMSRLIVPIISIVLYLLGYFIITIIKTNNTDHIKQLHKQTSQNLNKLMSTKYFRIIRLNLNQQCPLQTTNRICKSVACKICRCPQNDIPSRWIENDKVISRGIGIQQWQAQRKDDRDLIWDVEDQQNDKGQYFDLTTNMEHHTHFNGSYIWQLIYQQNCFGGQFDTMCSEQKILYRIISGLHTSISTHLSAFYSQPPIEGMEWLNKPTFKFNQTQYERRVLNHTQRINNLFFLYELVAKAIKEIGKQLTLNFTIQSDNITEDLKAISYLNNIIKEFENSNFIVKHKESLKFFNNKNLKIGQYQKYIHNISRILNCLDCQKCKLYGKMQTYGIGTALKILFGYRQPYKRNQIVALFNLFNKLSISVGVYYDHNLQQIKLEHLQPPFDTLKLYYFIFGAMVVIIYIFSRVDIQKKVKKNFRHAFPPNSSKFKIN